MHGFRDFILTVFILLGIMATGLTSRDLRPATVPDQVSPDARLILNYHARIPSSKYSQAPGWVAACADSTHRWAHLLGVSADERVILAIFDCEAEFDPTALSEDGSAGISQIRPKDLPYYVSILKHYSPVPPPREHSEIPRLSNCAWRDRLSMQAPRCPRQRVGRRAPIQRPRLESLALRAAGKKAVPAHLQTALKHDGNSAEVHPRFSSCPSGIRRKRSNQAYRLAPLFERLIQGPKES